MINSKVMTSLFISVCHREYRQHRWMTFQANFQKLLDFPFRALLTFLIGLSITIEKQHGSDEKTRSQTFAPKSPNDIKLLYSK